MRIGAGTQRLEAELARLVPGLERIRLDADTTSKPAELAAALDRFRSTDGAVLLGTQMVAKGHHFAGVELAAVIDADLGLAMPDFRAEERTFQLVTQLAGRSGREAPGRVIVQTFQPDAPALVYAARHDVTGFLAEELARREALGYPPFRHIVRVLVSGPDGGCAVARAHGAEVATAGRRRRRARPAAAPPRAPPRAARGEDRRAAGRGGAGRPLARRQPRRRCEKRACRRRSTSIRRASSADALSQSWRTFGTHEYEFPQYDELGRRHGVAPGREVHWRRGERARHRHRADEAEEAEERQPDPEREARRLVALAQIRQYPDPVLRMQAREVESFDDELAQLVERMAALMEHADGAGLAATQVGVLRRVFVMRAGENGDTRTLVNPELVSRSDEVEVDDEGCLSLQGLLVPVERSVIGDGEGEGSAGS